MSITNVAITNSLLGRLTIPISQIERLERNPIEKAETKSAEDGVAKPGAPPVPSTAPAASSRQPPAAPSPSNPQKPLPAPATTAAAPAKAAARAPAQPRPKAPRRWHIDAQVGVDLQYNQTHRQVYYGRAKWTYGKDRFRSIADYIANYGKTDGVLSANDMNGSVRLELDLARAKKLYLYNAAGAGYNDVRKIDLVYDESLGAGYKIIALTNFVYSMDVGVNHQEQFFADSTSKNYQAFRTGEQMNWKISSKLSLDQKFEYYQRFTGWEDYRMRFEANLKYLVMPNITLNLTAIDLYDTQPAPGVSRNDLLLRASVGLTF